MAALRAAICNAFSGWWKHNVSIQVLWDLTTVARQPGETAASVLKPSHIFKIFYMFHQYVFYGKNNNRHFINVGRKYFINNIYTVYNI